MIDSSINIYGIILIISFIAGSIVMSYSSKFLKEELIIFLIYEFLGMILGGKLYTYLTQYPIYKNTHILYIGFSSLGSLIGAFFMTFIYAVQFKVSLKKMFNIVAPAIPLMYAIGKIGCFIAGCCVGFKYSGFGSITYNYSHTVTNEFSYFPVQIVESIVFFGIFVFIYYLKRKNNDMTFNICLATCGISKFLLEFLRLRENVKILSINQIVCLLIVLLAIGIYLKNRYIKNRC